MNEVIYLFLQRMRRPILVLLLSYAVAVLGMALMPMVDENGEMNRLSIFQAFYWVSYTATTIGYGEVPVAFSQWQRIWAAFSIYYTVPAWLYAAGKIIALLGDQTFQDALRENRFAQRVSKLHSRFVIICGFGEAGKRLVHRLQAQNYVCVVVDIDADRINRMALDPALHNVLALKGNAADVELLTRAGIRSPYCRAVLAITDNEEVNIKVALSARLLSSDRNRFKSICRTVSRQASANAHSFDTDFVINTSQVFANRLTVGLRRPSIANLLSRLNGTPNNVYEAPPRPPTGTWIICGYGALGRTLVRFLEYEGIDTVVINREAQGSLLKTQIKGKGTEAVTLREARIDRAQAIVAGLENDPDNLSIAMTAKQMQPSLFVVGRQNESSNARLFEMAGFDQVMEEADLLVSEIFPYLARPMLSRFIRLVRHQSEEWGRYLMQRIDDIAGDHNPNQYLLRITEKHAPTVIEHLKSGHLLRMQSLWTLANDSKTLNQALPLLLLREGKEILLPKTATNLQVGDQVLLLYHQAEVATRISRNCFDSGALYWTLHNREKVNSYLLNYLLKKFE